MSLQTLMEEAKKLTEEESRRLSAFLITLRREPNFAEDMKKLMDDKSDSSWATLDQFDQRYGIKP